MGNYSRLKGAVKKLIVKNAATQTGQIDTTGMTEDEYYTYLFTQNDYWSKPGPNHEEQLRWQIIENFLFYIKGFHSGKEVTGQLSILDLGCGRGWLSNLLSAYGTVTGIEPVRPVVEHAQKLFPGLNLMCGTTTDLLASAQHEKYDIIVCSEVIEHIPDDRKDHFLGEIWQLLKKDGFMVITTPRKDAQDEWMKYGTPGQPIEDWLSEEDLSKLLEKNKFNKHHISRFSISPVNGAPQIEIYQLWLTQKTL